MKTIHDYRYGTIHLGNIEKKKRMSISVLIPTNKAKINYPSISFPILELLTSTVKGITNSRLDLVNRAKGDILVMIDDDVIIDPKIWLGVKNLRRGQFIMSRGKDCPVLWFLAIHRDDYECIGFNQEFNYNVDVDFYLRATKRGLIPIFPEKGLITHVDHKRSFNIFREIESGKLRAYHPQFIELKYFRKWVWIMLIRFLSLNYYLMLRTVKGLTIKPYKRIERSLRMRNLILRPSMKFIKNKYKGKKIVGCEVGVFKGEHSFSILTKISNIERLYLVDPYIEYFDYEKFHDQDLMSGAEMKAHERLEKLRPKIIWIKAPFCADLIPEPLDFIYIDGDHSYKAVFSDISEAMKILKTDGVISGHDYYPVTNPNRKLFGVGQAVEETFKKFNYKNNDWWVSFNLTTSENQSDRLVELPLEPMIINI